MIKAGFILLGTLIKFLALLNLNVDFWTKEGCLIRQPLRTLIELASVSLSTVFHYQLFSIYQITCIFRRAYFFLPYFAFSSFSNSFDIMPMQNYH